MEQHPIWRGHLRLALVSCPVALYATHHERGALHFNLINPETGNRIRMASRDADTGDEVARGDLVKGYEYKKGTYLLLTEADFDTARVESSATMTIGKFVKSDSIDPIYFDSSYYVAADDKSGRDVYKVLWQAIRDSGMAALSRVVIARRERSIVIQPFGAGLVAHTLLEEREINDPKSLFDDMDSVKADPEMVKLAIQLIDRQVGKYDPADFEDRYEARLRDLIEAKLKGKGLEPTSEIEPDRGNVVDLMAALKRSLTRSGSGEAQAKKPPRAQEKPQAPRSSTGAKAQPARRRAKS